jgi:hypothetical protein
VVRPLGKKMFAHQYVLECNTFATPPVAYITRDLRIMQILSSLDGYVLTMVYILVSISDTRREIKLKIVSYHSEPSPLVTTYSVSDADSLTGTDVSGMRYHTSETFRIGGL